MIRSKLVKPPEVLFIPTKGKAQEEELDSRRATGERRPGADERAGRN
jgi:hypothetical protein